MKRQAFVRDLLLGLAAYAGSLFLSNALLAGGGLTEPWRTIALLAPMAPAAAICVVIVRHMRRLDELQRRIQLEALATAFAGTALLTLGYGFLEGAGLPKLSMFVVWSLMGTLWAVASILLSRRYA